MTIAECAREAAAALVRAGHTRDDSRRDVAVLARHILGWDAATWLTRQQESAPPSFVDALDILIRRRGLGEPVAYLLGEKEFYGRTFIVTPDVLIPRPETELAIDVACVRIDRFSEDRGVRVVDVGTGSGAIAVTLAAERSRVNVVATDVSQAALAIAAANAARHGVASRIEFRLVPLTGDVRDVDLIVSNPPYVPAAEKDTLMRDVRDHEPALALFGGDDGLDVIRRLIPAAFASLRVGGALVMEIGAGQFDDVAALLGAAGFTSIAPHRDLAGIVRIVEAERSAKSV